MNIFLLWFLLTAILFQSGDLLECYKCPVQMRDMLYCSDPFENLNYQKHCNDNENVCLKISAQDSGNHVNERGCAKNSSVADICSSVRKNFRDVTCTVCETDLCNTSIRRESTTSLLLVSTCIFTLKVLLYT